MVPFSISLICITSPCLSQHNKFMINNDLIIKNLMPERNIGFQNVKYAKIVINQDYGEAGNIALPFVKDFETFLHFAGIKIDSVDYNMIVRIYVKGVASSNRYSSYDNSKTEYVLFCGAQLYANGTKTRKVCVAVNPHSSFCGAYWNRTSDLLPVKQAL